MTMRFKAIFISLIILLAVGVGVYAQDPTATPVPPTATPLPTATPIPPTATPLPTATPIPLAPFVSPQSARPDGSVVHVVQYGDTLDGIIFAYSSQGISITIDDLSRFNNWRFKPQYIFVGDEIIILPPGSVDPNTGQLLVLPSNIPGAQPTAAPTTVPAETAATPETAAPATDNVPSEPSVPAAQSIEPFVPVSSLK